MKFGEEQYLCVLKDILREGEEINDERTGVGTLALTNQVIEHGDVNLAFPVLITKKIPFKVVIGELLWFLEGSGSDRRLAEITFGDGDHKTIWTANWESNPYRYPTQSIKNATDFQGARNLGQVYGVQWRNWSARDGTPVDQIQELIDGIKKDPSGRRHMVTAWRPDQLGSMSLPPCHLMFQCNVIAGHLDLCWFQRSADMFLGIPFNMASYAALMHIIAKECNLIPRKLTGFIGNAHIYSNHMSQVKELISRKYDIPYFSVRQAYNERDKLLSSRLNINNNSQLFNSDGSIGYSVDDFSLSGYNPMSTIQAPMAV